MVIGRELASGRCPPPRSWVVPRALESRKIGWPFGSTCAKRPGRSKRPGRCPPAASCKPPATSPLPSRSFLQITRDQPAALPQVPANHPRPARCPRAASCKPPETGPRRRTRQRFPPLHFRFGGGGVLAEADRQNRPAQQQHHRAEQGRGVHPPRRVADKAGRLHFRAVHTTPIDQ